ncbi:MAG: hypothetical protein ACJ8J0_20105 [Longimicrobiaceae bacterium]
MQASCNFGSAEPPRIHGARRLRPRPPPPPGAPPVPPAPPAGEYDEGRLLRPAAACPRCGARPALRVTLALVRVLDGQPAALRVGTYQCQRRGCGAIYDLSAAACLRAS